MVSGHTKLGYFKQNFMIIFIIVSGNEKNIRIPGSRNAYNCHFPSNQKENL